MIPSFAGGSHWRRCESACEKPLPHWCSLFPFFSAICVGSDQAFGYRPLLPAQSGWEAPSPTEEVLSREASLSRLFFLCLFFRDFFEVVQEGEDEEEESTSTTLRALGLLGRLQLC